MQSGEAALEHRFRQLGGVFLTPPSLIASRLRRVRVIVFDWDGVFNAGVKGNDVESTFSEPDSMGTNLLRFALWRVRKEMPICAIISGENNETARRFAVREHFHEVMTGVKNKSSAFDAFCNTHRVAPDEVAFVFDDVNDLGAAANCGVRILVRRDASPLLQDFVALNSLSDYITAKEVGAHPVRETAELLMGLLNCYDVAVAARMSSDASYDAYFAERQSIHTEVVRFE
jgi:3-deoxy-D-manno-octulosonate 8-phosphate phosphatase (KDO 8-P phosphatase)